MARFIDNIRSGWLGWSVATRIIGVNVAIFVTLHLVALAGVVASCPWLEPLVRNMIELPANISMFISRPWTIFTYMFGQYDVLHLLFNMMWLYLFGSCFLDVYSGRNLFGLYIGGGIAGALFFIAGAAIFGSVSNAGSLVGASAAVLAIATAIALTTPTRSINFMFIGSVQLKWVAVVMIAIDLLNLGTGNAGGHIAHLGGVAAGAAYWAWLRKRPWPTPRKPEPANEARTIDELLDKIRLSGYSSLTPAERDLLFKLSNKLK